MTFMALTGWIDMDLVQMFLPSVLNCYDFVDLLTFYFRPLFRPGFELVRSQS